MIHKRLKAKQVLKLQIVIVVFLFQLSSVLATNYYVSATGSDKNKGTSLSSSWKTINYAASFAKAGDTVFISPGIYKETVTVANSGIVGKPIVFKGSGSVKPIIDGTGISSGYGTYDGLIKTIKRSNIVIENIEINNAPNAGIAINGPNISNIVIRNIKTNQTGGPGIWCNGQAGNAYTGIVNLLIEDCEIIKSHYQQGKGYNESLSVSGGCSKVIVRNNHVHHSGPGVMRGGPVGIDLKDGIKNAEIYKNHVHDISNSTGIYTDGWDSTNDSIKIYNNLVYNCLDAGISIGAESNGFCKNVSVYNNIVYSNGYAGVSVAGYGHDSNHISGIEIYNNTIYKNGNEAFGGISISDKTADVIIKNNIISENYHYQIWTDYINPGIKVSHNVLFGIGSNADYGNYFILSNPGFEDASANNFKLRSNSPAINRGTAVLHPLNDFDGNIRPVGDLPDLGAYEYPEILPVNPWPPGSEKFVDSDPSNVVINDSFRIDPKINLIKGGDFEGISSFSGAWAGWGGNSISTHEYVSPTHSLKISPASGGGGAAYIIDGIQEGIEYEFKFKAKMSDPAPIDPFSGYYKVAVSIMFKSKGGKRLTIPDEKINSTSWKSYSIKTTAPQYAYRMECNVWSFGTTAATFFDDWELYAVGGENTITSSVSHEYPEMDELVKVMPNPTNGRISLDFSNSISSSKTIDVFNSVGIKIFSKDGITDNNFNIDLSGNPVGLYFIAVQTEKYRKSYSLILKN